MEGSSLKTIALKLKKDLIGTLQTNVTQFPQPQPQPSPSTQPRSTHSRLMWNQMEIQLETCKIMITASKSLAQDFLENKKGNWKKIPSMYNKMLFVMSSEDRENPIDKISAQWIVIFDTTTDT